MSDDASRRRELAGGVVVFGLIFILIAVDLATDWGSGVRLPHLIAELGVLLVSASGAVILWRRFTEAREAVAGLSVDIEAARRDASRWREEVSQHVGGVHRAIEHQLERWSLTAAEQAVALGLLRGLSHKEIALERDTSERTVRQQARAVYQKAGLPGRSALAAFFLDDVLAAPPKRTRLP